MYITFGNSVKYFRRLSYRYGPDVLAIVIAQSNMQLRYAIDEACRMMDGGSLSYVYNRAKYEITTERGSVLRFRSGMDYREIMDKYIRGVLPAQVILLDPEPPEEFLNDLKANMGRSMAIDSKDERIDIAAL